MLDLSAILNISDGDLDAPQMGLSKPERAKLLARGATKDGGKIDPSIIKADKKLSDVESKPSVNSVVGKPLTKEALLAAKPQGKGRKVVTGSKPVSGKVLSEGAISKDGFAEVKVSIPVMPKDKVVMMEVKGQKIGAYLVDGDKKAGYGITHIPSGLRIVTEGDIEYMSGKKGLESVKDVAKKLSQSGIELPNSMPKSFKNTKVGKKKYDNQFGELAAFIGFGKNQKHQKASKPIAELIKSMK